MVKATATTFLIFCLSASFLAHSSHARSLRVRFPAVFHHNITGRLLTKKQYFWLLGRFVTQQAHSGKSECGSLVRCTLRNTLSGTDIPLLPTTSGTTGGPTAAAAAAQSYDPSGRYTLQCEISGNLNKMNYIYLDSSSGSTSSNNHHEIHRDTMWNQPWLSNELATTTLSSNGKITLQVVGETWTTECFAEEFTLTSSSSRAPTGNNAASCGSNHHYACPIYARPKDGVSCAQGLDDCKCQYSYKLVSGHCVKDWCYHDYQCPSPKERVPGIDCYSSVRDCRFPRVGVAVVRARTAQ
jgi:hypothetical protein